MKKIVLIIVPALICGIALMTGCEKQESDLEGVDGIIGCWANPVYEYDNYPKAIICYKRVKTLPTNSPSIKFLDDETLVERKNSGDCATPPIAYGDFSGNWQIENNNEIKIDVDYWGGVEQKTWKIISVTNTSLRIEINVEDTQYNKTTENEIDLSDSRIGDAQIVCCGVQAPQQNLTWLNDIIKKANTDATLENNVGTIWLEEYKGKDIFVTDMKFGSGGLMYHLFDCSGNNFALQIEKEELDSFTENMKLNIVVYSNLNKFLSEYK